MCSKCRHLCTKLPWFRMAWTSHSNGAAQNRKNPCYYYLQQRTTVPTLLSQHSQSRKAATSAIINPNLKHPVSKKTLELEMPLKPTNVSSRKVRHFKKSNQHTRSQHFVSLQNPRKQSTPDSGTNKRNSRAKIRDVIEDMVTDLGN